MRLVKTLAMAAGSLAAAAGCSTLNHTENGALAGGGIGAATGALIGHATGHTAGGALIGAGAGALAGGLIGHAADQSDKRQAIAQAQRQVGITEVAQMAQQHISDDVIINQILSSGSVYQLSSQDTIWLKQNGVSDRVIEVMMNTSRYPRRVYTAVPVYGEPAYVVEPAPPPVSVGVGVVGRIR
jgi:hypothetical protein